MAKSDKQAWEELVEIKKHKQGLDTPEEAAALMPEKPENVQPVGFKAKWKNYWYHYKAVTWISVGVAVVLTVGIVDMVRKPRYDVTVVVPTAGFISDEQTAQLEKNLTPITPDVNGNGESLINVTALPGIGKDMTYTQKLMAMLSAGDFSVMILDEDTFNQYFKEQTQALVNLAKRYPGDERVTADGVRWEIKDSTLLKGMKTDDSTQKLYICLRDLSSSAFTGKKEAKQTMDAAYEIMDALHKANATGTK